MPLGNTGRLMYIPVVMATGIIGLGLMMYNAPPLAKRIFSMKRDPIDRPNDIATVFVASPPESLLDEFPDLSDHTPCPIFGTLATMKLVVQVLAGFLASISVVFPSRKITFVLFLITCGYGLIYIVTQALVFYQYRNHNILEFSPFFRETRGKTFALFGTTEWPYTFWYDFTIKTVGYLASYYFVLDLFYSFHLILKVGGSGWEMLPPRELPGWDDYEKKQKVKRSSRRAMYYGPTDSEAEDDENDEEQMPINGPGAGAAPPGGGLPSLTPFATAAAQPVSANGQRTSSGENGRNDHQAVQMHSDDFD